MNTHPSIQQRDPSGWQNLPADWPDCLRRVLAARGIEQKQDLQFELADLPKPDALLGMPAAVELLATALASHWNVMIVADFDTDGATSCAVMIRGLRLLGLQHVTFIVPSRFKHGYGLTPALLDEIPTAEQPNLLITVDNGIASVEGVSRAKARGMHVLITDHHLPGEQLPDADAIVNPNQPDDLFPSKAMAGVGVAFYLLLGFRQHLLKSGWFEKTQTESPKLINLIDLVALGTVADVVPLDKLNRSLVNLGLNRMRRGQTCAGIKALLQIAGKAPSTLSTQDLAFAVAPRLNAAGRMQDMGVGIETLLMDEFDQALQAAQLLDQINLQRRQVEATMQRQANSMLAKIDLNTDQKANVYCLYNSDWHQGVVGLLASRIKEKMHRPVIIFAPGDEGEIKGSARSISGVHIRDVLARIDSLHPTLITRFGGHAMAAGLTLPLDNFVEFEKALKKIVSDWIEPHQLERQLLSDGELSAEEMTLSLAQRLPIAAPWGQAFAEPVFHGVFNLLAFKAVGQQADHLRLQLALDDGKSLTAMAFRQQIPDWLYDADKVLLRYRLNVNDFRQQLSMQLLVEDLLPS